MKTCPGNALDWADKIENFVNLTLWSVDDVRISGYGEGMTKQRYNGKPVKYECACGAEFTTKGGADRHAKPYPPEHKLSGQSKCRAEESKAA